MKLANVAKGTRAVKTVTFRLANAPLLETPPEPGQPLPRDEYTVDVGVRVLTGSEVAEVYQKAQADAVKAGVKEWLDTHPLCRLYEMAHTLAVACVDAEKRDEPFFASVQEILDSPAVGADNITFLYEQHGAWQDECSVRVKYLSVAQVIGLLSQEADRPENAKSPFSLMRAATLVSCLHISAKLFANLLTAKLDSGSSGDSSTSESSSASPEVE